MLQPREESLMRKKKVKEILKTFQEDEPAGVSNDNDLGDQKYSSGRDQQLSFHKEAALINQTMSTKPIIISKRNRVKMKQQTRRREVAGMQNERDRARARVEDSNEKQQQLGLMSDLNEFMMCEDSKIFEQEQRFKDEWAQPMGGGGVPAEGDFTGLQADGTMDLMQGLTS